MRSLRRKKTVDGLFDLAFVLPQLLLYLVLTIVPFVVAIPMIFTDYANFLDHNVHFVGLQNVVSIFEPPIVSQFLQALGRTSLFTVLNYAMMFILGLPLALVMYELRSRSKAVFFAFVFLPLMLSGVGTGMIMSMLFSRDTGSLNLLLLKIGILHAPIDVNNPAATPIVLPALVGWRYAGFNMAIFLSGLLAISDETIEASIVDGATYAQRLARIYLPQIIPSISITSILTLLGSYGVFDELIGLGALRGNQGAVFLSVLIYKMGFSSVGGGGSMQSGSLAQGVAISIVVFIPLLVIAFMINRLQRRLQY